MKMLDIVINDRGFVNIDPQISYGICPTLRAESHGNIPKVIACAIRGRYNEDGKVEQQLELNTEDYINALTSVQKDSLVLEISK